MLPLKLLCRAAGRLQAALLGKVKRVQALEETLLSRLTCCQRALTRAARLVEKARGRGWFLILPRLRDELLGTLKAFQDAAQQVRQCLERRTTTPDLPALAAELRQLEGEFGETQIDWKDQALTAVTEPIVLRDVPLGAFAIRFHWIRLSQHDGTLCFEVVALHPNPAGCDSRVTHPHVKNNTLCVGDAAAPLQRALEQGRLADAFCLVRSVLTHYNPASPFVHLSAWDGIPCYDCGCIPTDDRLSCPGCEHEFCTECTRQCDSCEAVRCTDCMGRCTVCTNFCCFDCIKASQRSGRECCPDCATSCSACGAVLTREELAEGTGLCPECAAKRRPEPETRSTAPASPSPVANSPGLEIIHEQGRVPTAPSVA
jgi:hypothetical protein